MEAISLSNIEAEKALLASLLLEPDLIWQEYLPAEAFANERNRLIYLAISDLIKERKIQPDIITLQEELEKRGILETCGGLAYISTLLTAAPSSLYYRNHLTVVMDYWRRRKVYLEAQKLANVALQGNDFDDKVQESMSEMAKSLTKGKVISQSLASTVSEVYDEILEKAKSPREITGVSTGISPLDKAIKGFHLDRGEAIYMGGEPGVGKTILATQICVNLARPDIGNSPGVIYSLEMNKKQLVYRMLSGLAKINASNLDSGYIQGKETDLLNACEKLAGLPIYISDKSTLTIAELRADLAKQVANGAKWYMLDYLQRLDGYNHLDELQRGERISQDLVGICQDLGIGGLIISAVTKDVMDGGMPTKKSLRGSGMIIHDADVVMFVVQHQGGNGVAKNENMRTILIDKNRNYKSKISFDLILVDGVMAFENVAKLDLSEAARMLDWTTRKDIE